MREREEAPVKEAAVKGRGRKSSLLLMPQGSACKGKREKEKEKEEGCRVLRVGRRGRGRTILRYERSGAEGTECAAVEICVLAMKDAQDVNIFQQQVSRHSGIPIEGKKIALRRNTVRDFVKKTLFR